MIRRILTILTGLLLVAAGTAQAQSYPDDLEVYRADGGKIRLIRKVDGPDGWKYYQYSEFEINGPGTCSYTATNKTQTMWNLAIVLGRGNAKYINEDYRTGLMRDDAGNMYTVQLPTRDELAALRAANGNDLPFKWRITCVAGGQFTQIMSGLPEFWTSSWWWNDHYTYSLQTGKLEGRWDTDQRAVALRLRKIDDSQVCLYQHDGFNGEFQCYGSGDYGWVGSMNDQISSLIAGKNCMVRVFEHRDWEGQYVTYNDLKRSGTAMESIGAMNDRISSLSVRCGTASSTALKGPN